MSGALEGRVALGDADGAHRVAGPGLGRMVRQPAGDPEARIEVDHADRVGGLRPEPGGGAPDHGPGNQAAGARHLRRRERGAEASRTKLPRAGIEGAASGTAQHADRQGLRVAVDHAASPPQDVDGASDTGAAEIVRHGDLGVRHLVRMPAAELQHGLVELPDARRAHRVPFGEQAARGIDWRSRRPPRCAPRRPSRRPRRAAPTRGPRCRSPRRWRSSRAAPPDPRPRGAMRGGEGMPRSRYRRLEGADVGVAGDPGGAAGLHGRRGCRPAPRPGAAPRVRSRPRAPAPRRRR